MSLTPNSETVFNALRLIVRGLRWLERRMLRRLSYAQIRAGRVSSSIVMTRKIHPVGVS